MTSRHATILGALLVATAAPGQSVTAAAEKSHPATATLEARLTDGVDVTLALKGHVSLEIGLATKLPDGTVTVPIDVKDLHLGGGGAKVVDSDSRQSWGAVVGPNDPDRDGSPWFPADGSLDLALEVRLGGGRPELRTADAVHLVARVRSLPPTGATYESTGGTDLHTRGGQLAGRLTRLVIELAPSGQSGGGYLPPFPLVLEPDHSEELFGRRDGVFGTGPVPVPRGSLYVSAEEWDLREVDSTRFSISADGGGTWQRLGTDRVDERGLIGINPDPRFQVFDGHVGYRVPLDTTGLAAGEYLLRAEMQAGGQKGAGYRLIRVLDAPPRIRIVEPFETTSTPPLADPPLPSQEEPRIHGNEVSGAVPIAVEPPGRGRLAVDLYEGSGTDHDQTGLGGQDQNKLGPNMKDTVPPKNQYCAPTAGANALWRQAQKDMRILNGKKADGSSWLDFIKDCIKKLQAKYPDDPKEPFDFGEEVAAFYKGKKDEDYVKDGKLTQQGLGMALACKMGTDPNDGTTGKNAISGFADFFKEQGIDGDYAGSTWDLGVDGNKGEEGESDHPGKGKLLEEIGKDEMTLILLTKAKGDGSHLVTGKDYKDDGKGKASVSFVDPDGAGEVDAPVGKDQNGNTGLKYKGEWWLVAGIISQSPTPEAREKFVMRSYRPLGEDPLGEAYVWDTTSLQDGFHTVRATVCANDSCGSDHARFYVNNRVPLPVVNVQQQGPLALFTICESTGAEDVVAHRLQVGFLQVQGAGLPQACLQEQLGPLPPGPHNWLVVLEDYSGRMGQAIGTIFVP